MKKVLLPIILSFAFTITFAQKEGNTWYFSTNRGIDFNSGSAVLLTNSGMSEYEGCSSISDPATGSILIYTDGMTVYNANHNIMQNGSGLQSTYAAGQQGLIVPDPGNADQYYIFTSGEYFSGGTDGYRYNIVDMTQNGGLGAVTAVKNVLLYAPASEKLCAIKTAAGDGYWVATHEYSTNNFQIYELTASGLSSPVTSSVGTNFSGVNPDGCMKFSPDGTRITLSLGGSNEVEVFDFDASTGIVSNPITLGPVAQQFPYVYGVCFSPSGTRLYATEENDTNLYQFDLTLGSQALINASKIAVGSTSSYALQTMQLAPDGKMYVARNGGAYLAVVHDPDSLGLLCNFVDNGFSMGGGFSSYGLPNFPESLFTEFNPPAPQPQFASSDTSVCEKFCINFYDSSANNPTSWQWVFPGGSPSTSALQNPADICYTQPGIYDVTLITANANGTDTLLLPGFITVNPTPPFPTITHTGYTLTSSPASAYQWQLNAIDITGATNQSHAVMQSGYYTVVIGDSNGCKNSATTYVLISGVDDVDDEAHISIYPNPSSGSFTIEFTGQTLDGVSFDVVNALGQKVFSTSEKISSFHWTKEIDLCIRDARSCVSTGIYFLEIQSSTFYLKKKLMIIQ